MNRNEYITLAISILLFFVIFLSQGNRLKEDYELSKLLDNKILTLFREMNQESFEGIYDENGQDLGLSNDSINRLVNSLMSLRGYGPSHPVIKNTYNLVIGDKFDSYKLELIKANESSRENIYINVIVGNRPDNVFKEFTYTSAELVEWGKDHGIIK